MQDFSITTLLTTKEYTRIMFVGLYKKPVFILATNLGIIESYSETPFFEISCGAFLLLAPTIITFIAVQQFKSNPSFKNDITYTFTNNSVSCQGLTFKSEFLWTHIIKQKEIGKYLILYHTKKFGSFIDKTKLTTEQIEFIKSKVGHK
jgi:hypothetical protein